jgi:hypothetical protein
MDAVCPLSEYAGDCCVHDAHLTVVLAMRKISGASCSPALVSVHVLRAVSTPLLGRGLLETLEHIDEVWLRSKSHTDMIVATNRTALGPTTSSTSD